MTHETAVHTNATCHPENCMVLRLVVTGTLIMFSSVTMSEAQDRMPNQHAGVIPSVTRISSSHTQSRDMTLVAFTEPYQTVELAAAEMGRISVLNIRRGTQVQEGDLLCELDVATLAARRHSIEQRGTSTSRRDALEIEHHRKQRRYESLRSIVMAGGGTPEEIAEAEADVKIAALNVQAANEELEQVQLELAEIDAQIAQRQIRASMNGIIIDVHRHVGEFVPASDPKVATLVDLSRLRASFFLPTEAASRYREGQQTELRFSQSHQLAPCIVEYVGPLTYADSGRVRVDVVIDNSTKTYRSGIRCMLAEF